MIDASKAVISPTKEAEKTYYSTRDAATLLDVSPGTIQRMVDAGELVAWKTRGGHLRIEKEAVREIRDSQRPRPQHGCGGDVGLIVLHPDPGAAQQIRTELATWDIPSRNCVVQDPLEMFMESVRCKTDVVLHYVRDLTPTDVLRMEAIYLFFLERDVIFAAFTDADAYEQVAGALRKSELMTFIRTCSLDAIKEFVRAQWTLNHMRDLGAQTTTEA